MKDVSSLTLNSQGRAKALGKKKRKNRKTGKRKFKKRKKEKEKKRKNKKEVVPVFDGFF